MKLIFTFVLATCSVLSIQSASAVSISKLKNALESGSVIEITLASELKQAEELSPSGVFIVNYYNHDADKAALSKINDVAKKYANKNLVVIVSREQAPILSKLLASKTYSEESVLIVLDVPSAPHSYKGVAPDASTADVEKVFNDVVVSQAYFARLQKTAREKKQKTISPAQYAALKEKLNKKANAQLMLENIKNNQAEFRSTTAFNN